MTTNELLACLVDRPCSACKFHTEQGCSKWSCVFEDKTEEWIPCEERLPAEKQDVLMMFKGNMAVGFWEDILGDGNPVWYANSGDGWFTGTETVDSDGVPIAWMSLPTDYESEGGE